MWEGYLELRPPREWRFVKTHRRTVLIDARNPNAATTTFHVQKNERLDLVSADGLPRWGSNP